MFSSDQIVTISQNDAKKLRANFDWKTDLMLESTKSAFVDPEIRGLKPSESDLNQRGTWIVHDIQEDNALKELMQKV